MLLFLHNHSLQGYEETARPRRLIKPARLVVRAAGESRRQNRTGSRFFLREIWGKVEGWRPADSDRDIRA